MGGGVVFWSVLPLVDKAGIRGIEDVTIGRLVNGSSFFGIIIQNINSCCNTRHSITPQFVHSNHLTLYIVFSWMTGS